jgi:hypothetical protein
MMIRLKIRFVLYDLQNNKHCVGGCRRSPSDAKVRRLFEYEQRNFLKHRIACPLILEGILVFIEIEEQFRIVPGLCRDR